MRHLITIFGFLLVLGSPARADLPLAEQDRIWAMIVDGDFHALETTLQRVHSESVETQVFQPVRDHNKMFETTHPDAGRTFERWLEAMPNSPYANAALLWQKFHIAWQIRGTKTASETPPDDLAAFSALKAEGAVLANKAYALAPDYVAASDGIINTVKMDQEQLFSFVQAVIRDTPNYGTIMRATYPASPQWGGSWELVARLCDLSVRTDDASVQDCRAQSIIDHSKDMRLRREAIEYFVDKFFDGNTQGHTHDIVAVYGSAPQRFDRAGQEKVAEAILDKARNDGDYREVWTDADLLMTNTRSFQDLAGRVREIAAARFFEVAKRDPLNVAFAQRLAENEFYPLDGSRRRPTTHTRNKALGFWKNALVYGAHRSSVWSQGASIVSFRDQPDGYRRAYPMHVNAIAYENPPVLSSDAMFGFYYRTYKKALEAQAASAPGASSFDDAAEAIEFIECPLLRSAKLLIDNCARHNDFFFNSHPCNADYGNVPKAKDVVEITSLRQACRKESFTPARFLQYEPLPMSTFADILDLDEIPESQN